MQTSNVTVKSVSEYLDAVKGTFQILKAPDELASFWFRGEASANWVTSLCPKAYRIYGGPVDNKEMNDYVYSQWRGVEGNIRAVFSREAYRYINKTAIPTGRWNQYFLMQHYGLKTRLLDWTENALTALFSPLVIGLLKITMVKFGYFHLTGLINLLPSMPAVFQLRR